MESKSKRGGMEEKEKRKKNQTIELQAKKIERLKNQWKNIM